MKAPRIRRPYEREPSRLSHFSASRTKQSFQDECDINNILRQVQKSGMTDHTNRSAPSFEDLTMSPDSYHEAVTQVLAAQEAFAALPSAVRGAFQNEPGELIAYLAGNPSREDMKKHGLGGLLKPDLAPPPPGGSGGAEHPQGEPSGAPEAPQQAPLGRQSS